MPSPDFLEGALSVNPLGGTSAATNAQASADIALKKKNISGAKWFAIIASILFILAALGFGLWYAYKHSTSNSSTKPSVSSFFAYAPSGSNQGTQGTSLNVYSQPSSGYQISQPFPVTFGYKLSVPASSLSGGTVNATGTSVTYPVTPTDLTNGYTTKNVTLSAPVGSAAPSQNFTLSVTDQNDNSSDDSNKVTVNYLGQLPATTNLLLTVSTGAGPSSAVRSAQIYRAGGALLATSSIVTLNLPNSITSTAVSGTYTLAYSSSPPANIPLTAQQLQQGSFTIDTSALTESSVPVTVTLQFYATDGTLAPVNSTQLTLTCSGCGNNIAPVVTGFAASFVPPSASAVGSAGSVDLALDTVTGGTVSTATLTVSPSTTLTYDSQDLLAWVQAGLSTNPFTIPAPLPTTVTTYTYTLVVGGSSGLSNTYTASVTVPVCVLITGLSAANNGQNVDLSFGNIQGYGTTLNSSVQSLVISCSPADPSNLYPFTVDTAAANAWLLQLTDTLTLPPPQVSTATTFSFTAAVQSSSTVASSTVITTTYSNASNNLSITPSTPEVQVTGFAAQASATTLGFIFTNATVTTGTIQTVVISANGPIDFSVDSTPNPGSISLQSWLTSPPEPASFPLPAVSQATTLRFTMLVIMSDGSTATFVSNAVTIQPAAPPAPGVTGFQVAAGTAANTIQFTFGSVANANLVTAASIVVESPASLSYTQTTGVLQWLNGTAGTALTLPAPSVQQPTNVTFQLSLTPSASSTITSNAIALQPSNASPIRLGAFNVVPSVTTPSYFDVTLSSITNANQVISASITYVPPPTQQVASNYPLSYINVAEWVRASGNAGTPPVLTIPPPYLEGDLSNVTFQLVINASSKPKGPVANSSKAVSLTGNMKIPLQINGFNVTPTPGKSGYLDATFSSVDGQISNKAGFQSSITVNGGKSVETGVTSWLRGIPGAPFTIAMSGTGSQRVNLISNGLSNQANVGAIYPGSGISTNPLSHPSLGLGEASVNNLAVALSIDGTMLNFSASSVTGISELIFDAFFDSTPSALGFPYNSGVGDWLRGKAKSTLSVPIPKVSSSTSFTFTLSYISGLLPRRTTVTTNSVTVGASIPPGPQVVSVSNFRVYNLAAVPSANDRSFTAPEGSTLFFYFTSTTGFSSGTIFSANGDTVHIPAYDSVANDGSGNYWVPFLVPAKAELPYSYTLTLLGSTGQVAAALDTVFVNAVASIPTYGLLLFNGIGGSIFQKNNYTLSDLNGNVVLSNSQQSPLQTQLVSSMFTFVPSADPNYLVPAPATKNWTLTNQCSTCAISVESPILLSAFYFFNPDELPIPARQSLPSKLIYTLVNYRPNPPPTPSSPSVPTPVLCYDEGLSALATIAANAKAGSVTVYPFTLSLYNFSGQNVDLYMSQSSASIVAPTLLASDAPNESCVSVNPLLAPLTYFQVSFFFVPAGQAATTANLIQFRPHSTEITKSFVNSGDFGSLSPNPTQSTNNAQLFLYEILGTLFVATNRGVYVS